MQFPARSAFAVLAALFALAGGARAQIYTTQRVSLSSEGGEANFNSSTSSLSADGRRLAFESGADNLVPGDTNGQRDIFLHDRNDGRTVRVSVGTGGVQSNGDSTMPSISADGRFVAFMSEADNLVSPDGNGALDVFLHDTLSGQTTRVSVDSQGQEANDHSQLDGPWSVSGDGRLVGFSSAADNLVPGDSNGERDAFVHDLVSGATRRISVDSSGIQGNGDSARTCLSADGLSAIFDSSATNLGGGATADKRCVYFRDLQSRLTQLVSSTTWYSLAEHLSSDARYVVYRPSFSSNPPNVFVLDRRIGQTFPIGMGAGGFQPNGPCYSASISTDGRFVAFGSDADNLTFPDFNGSADVFLVDRSIGKTFLVSWGIAGQLKQSCFAPRMSADGSSACYNTNASRVVPFDQNDTSDLFAIALTGCAPTVASYCAPSSTSIPGCEASLTGSGLPSLSNASAFALSAAPMPGGTTGLMFWGLHGPDDEVVGTQGGRICVASPFARTLVLAAGGTGGVCDGRIDLTLLDLLAIDPFQVQAGHTVHVQSWFRDPGSADGFGLSSGLWFNVCP